MSDVVDLDAECECDVCGEPVDPSDIHFAEALEQTGKIMCSDCFEEMCEADCQFEDEDE